MVLYVQSVLGIIIAAGAVGSMWFINRRVLVAEWCARVESVAALALIGTVIWRDDSPWAMLPVWVLTACAALGNAWLLRKTERRRRERLLAELDELVELDRQRQQEWGTDADRRERDRGQ